MDDRQLEAFRVARKFRTLLGRLNTIEWHQFFDFDKLWLVTTPTDDRLPPFGQFRTDLQNAFSHLPHGSRLIRAFEGLAVKTEPEWAPAKAAAWSRFHELCDYLGFLRYQTGTPVLENTQSAIIVPGNRVKEFDFSICCDIQFEAFPEGAASYYEFMRTGSCGTCGMPLTVTAIDTAVLNRVYRKCIVKERLVVNRPKPFQENDETESPQIISAASATDLLKVNDKDAHLYRDGNQWCSVAYARTIGVSEKHIDRARNGGCYEVQLTDRRKADTKGRPYVYRRAELSELAEAIPDEHKYQPK